MGKLTVMMACRAFALITLLGSVAIVFVSQSANAAQRLSVNSYHANPEGFLSNSHIVSSDSEALLVDAQFSAKEGSNVASIIGSGEQRLSKIIVTHPHPDHYYGLEVLGKTFSDAQIVAGPTTIAEIDASITYWTQNSQEGDGFSKTLALKQDAFDFDGTRIEYRIFHSGESVENTVLYIPEQQILFVGDLASNGVHTWLAEGRFDNWLEQLKNIRSFGPIKSVYPGHGPVGGPALLDKAEDYIKNFKETVKTSNSAVQAIEKMTKLYPDYQLPQILVGSVHAAMPAATLKP